METNNQEVQLIEPGQISTEKPFIQANTESISLEKIRDSHIIPVFHKDNEPLISHSDFISSADDAIHEFYPGEMILRPAVRLSHPIMGRIPEAKYKPANQLEEHEKTLYYERMAFIIEISSISDEIDGNQLSLTIGGVKAFNLDNIYGRKGNDEHFKVFVGFQNRVCTNLCVWTDGYYSDLKVSNAGHLKACIRTLLENYNANYHLSALRRLAGHYLSEHQFAQLIGRSRMYQHLPKDLQNDIPALLFGDNHLNAICKDYYRDSSFCRGSNGDINLWKLYNLFTGANKSSYIDTFLDRSVNAYDFTEQIRLGLEGKSTCWYLG